MFWVFVWTTDGQRVDQWLFDRLGLLPQAIDLPRIVQVSTETDPRLWIALAAVVVVAVQIGRVRMHATMTHALVTTGLLLIFPVVAIVGARLLRDDVLIRPQIHDWITQTMNSAPSGHAAAATAAVVVLIRATPPLLRPWIAAVAGTWAALVEFGLIAVGWHRPSDVIISTLLVVGVGLLLPDPWPATRSAGRFALPLVAVAVTAAVPVIVGLHYPAAGPVGVAAVIAAVMGVSVAISCVGRRRVSAAGPDHPLERSSLRQSGDVVGDVVYPFDEGLPGDSRRVRRHQEVRQFVEGQV